LFQIYIFLLYGNISQLELLKDSIFSLNVDIFLPKLLNHLPEIFFFTFHFFEYSHLSISQGFALITGGFVFISEGSQHSP